jgi:phosphoglycolate phosphatase-like HAD superfamily hydrolase
MILCADLRLAVDDVAAVAVAGDTASDLWAGHRAGASIVAGVLTGAHDKDALAAAPHTHLLASIADLPGLLFSTYEKERWT